MNIFLRKQKDILQNLSYFYPATFKIHQIPNNAENPVGGYLLIFNVFPALLVVEPFLILLEMEV